MNTALAALIRNDLRLFFSDRRAMVITVLVPVAIASFFGMILGGGGGGGRAPSAVKLLVADADNSPVSQGIVANLQKDASLSVQTTTEAEARAAVSRGASPVALILPAGFGRASTAALFAGPNAERPTIPLLYDPSHSAEFQMARGLVMQQVMQVVSRRAFSAQSAPESVDEQLKAIGSDTTIPESEKVALTNLLTSVKQYYGRPATASTGEGGTEGGPYLQMPVNLKDEVVAGKDAARVGTVAHSFAGMAVQGVLFFAIDAAMGMLRDRRLGLWKRLRAAPLSRGTLLGSKILSTGLIALVIIGFVFGVGALLFGIRIDGSLPGFALVCLATSVMVAALGLLIAALGRTEAQSRGYAIPAVLAMSILGGAWFPSFLMPQWVQTLSLAIPTRWAVDGFDAMTWRGFDFSAALMPSFVLLGFAAVFGAIAFARFRWETE